MAPTIILPYLYPFLSIFCPCPPSFICGTLKMALISIFLSYLRPSSTICFPCLTANSVRDHRRSTRCCQSNTHFHHFLFQNYDASRSLMQKKYRYCRISFIVFFLFYANVLMTTPRDLKRTKAWHGE